MAAKPKNTKQKRKREVFEEEEDELQVPRVISSANTNSRNQIHTFENDTPRITKVFKKIEEEMTENVVFNTGKRVLLLYRDEVYEARVEVVDYLGITIKLSKGKKILVRDGQAEEFVEKFLTRWNGKILESQNLPLLDVVHEIFPLK